MEVQIHSQSSQVWLQNVWLLQEMTPRIVDRDAQVVCWHASRSCEPLYCKDLVSCWMDKSSVFNGFPNEASILSRSINS